MGHKKVEITVETQHWWGNVVTQCTVQIPDKFQNPHLVDLFSVDQGHGRMLYLAHVKCGHLGNHHTWTVEFEVKHGKGHLIKLEEGHRKIF